MGYERDWTGVGATAVIAFVAAAIAAFINHVWWIITICMAGDPITGGQVVLAILGIVFPPFGAVHGVWLWLH